MPDVIQLTRHRELFLDDYLIAEAVGLERRVNPVVKSPANPVLWPERDPEPRGYVPRSVVFDQRDRLYKCWCSGDSTPPAKGRPDLTGSLFYSSSSNGVNWERPELGVFAVDDAPGNLVSLSLVSGLPEACPYLNATFGVTLDPADPDPARRFKMGFLYLIPRYKGPRPDPFHPSEYRGFGVAFSPDGIHWTPHPEAVSLATCDGFTHWCHDVERGRWLLYGRTKYVSPEMTAAFGDDPAWRRTHWGRAVRWAESRDFLHWAPEEGERILAPDPEDGKYAEIYGMNVFTYEGIYIGMPQVFWNSPDDAHLDIQLAVSRDGRQFERLSDRTPFIPCGGVGAWDRFNNSNLTGPPIADGDRLRFYYGGRAWRHGGAWAGDDCGKGVIPRLAGMGMGAIERDRFAGLEASFNGGSLMTPPLLASGANLHLNAAARFGRIRITVLDAACHVLEETDLAGTDATDIAVPGVAIPGDAPFRLRLGIQNARLYALWTE